jgi:hypothetical protein
MAKLEVPEPIAILREYRGHECLSFSQLRMSEPALTLLMMCKAMLEALQSVGAALLAMVIRIIYGDPTMHWVGPSVAALLLNSVTLGLVTTTAFVAKSIPSRIIPICSTLTSCIQSMLTHARLHSRPTFREACSTCPRLTRARYTQTKLYQRRVLRGRHNPHRLPVKTKRAPRFQRSLKARKCNESDRIKSIMQRLAADAAKSRR